MSYYSEILKRVSRAIAATHGYVFVGESMIDSPNPRALLFSADAQAALETVDQFLGENEIEFADLEVASAYIMPKTIEVNNGESKISWEKINQLVDELYACWGVTRSDRSTYEQYELDKVAAIADAFSHAEIVSAYESLQAKALRPVTAPRTDKQKLAKAIFSMLNPRENQVELSLYFDSDYKCVGAQAADIWAKSHITNNIVYTHIRKVFIRAGFNPLNRYLREILEYNTDQAFGGQLPSPQPQKAATKPTSQPTPSPSKATTPRKLTKAELTLKENSFVGLDKVFNEYIAIKDFLAPEMKIGRLISSQSDIKGWYITGGEKGQDKAAIYWQQSGWTIDGRTVDDEPTGVFEEWDLMLHLMENEVMANGIPAAEWYDAIDREAEQEAINAQAREQRAKNLSAFYNQH